MKNVRLLVLSIACAVFEAWLPVARADPERGRWAPDVVEWPIIPIHALLTPEGRLMTFGTGTESEQVAMVYSVWDPVSGSHSTLPNLTPTDIFCAAQIVLPSSGDLMFAGGDNMQDDLWGNPNTTVFARGSQRLIDNPFTMSFARWYPTTTVLPSGEILVQGGSNDGFSGTGMLTPEIFNPSTGWRSLLGATSEYAYGDDFNRWFYPRSWVAPDGRLFGITGPAMYFLDYRGDGKLTEAGNFTGDNRGASSTAVMFRPGLILQVGGGSSANHQTDAPPGSRAASIIDIRGETPIVSATRPMQHGRHWANSTVLPDGRVLVTGGAGSNGANANAEIVATATKSAEVWDPVTGEWTELAAEQNLRHYHSVAILLPDATVLSGGSGSPGPVNHKNAQIFSPPYLFRGSEAASRLQITQLQSKGAEIAASYGTELELEVEGAAKVARVTLLKAGAVTHSFNNDQRFIELEFAATPTGIKARLPESSRVATPGFYLLFALDAGGTPSNGKFVHLPPPAPTIPPALTRPLVINGGFEAAGVSFTMGWGNYPEGSKIGPWRVVQGSVSVQDAGHLSMGAGGNTERRHVDLIGDTGAGTLEQVIEGLAPGGAYTLTFDYAKHLQAGASASGRVTISGLTQVFSAVEPGNQRWQRASYDFTAAAASAALAFTGLTASDCCGILIDNVRVEPLGR